MRRPFILLFLAVVVLMVTGSGMAQDSGNAYPGPEDPKNDPIVVEDQPMYEIVFDIVPGPGELPEAAANARQVGKTLPSLINKRAILPHNEQQAQAIMSALEHHPRVENLHKEYAIVGPPPHTGSGKVDPGEYGGGAEYDYDDYQWYHNNTGQVDYTHSEHGQVTVDGDWDLDSEKAWYHTTGDSDVVIAHIDTGVQLEDSESNSLVDLADANISYPTNCDLTNSPYQGDGCDDDSHWPHGTSTISVMAANNDDTNSTSMVGLCPECSYLVYDLYGNYSDNPPTPTWYWSWLADGIDDAVSEGADIIMINAGASDSYSCTSTINDAINDAWDAGAFLVAAAHNYSVVDPDESSEQPIYYPARSSRVFGVAAADGAGELSLWYPGEPLETTNWDPIYTQILSPGSFIWAVGRADPGSRWDTGEFEPYMSGGGTSHATPLVAAAAGLLLSEDSTLTNGDLWSILRQSGEYSPYAGSPLLNVHNALNLAGGSGWYEYDPVASTCDAEFVDEGWWQSFLVANPDSSSRSVDVTAYAGFDGKPVPTSLDKTLTLPSNVSTVFNPGYMYAPTCSGTLTNGCRFAFSEVGDGDGSFPYPHEYGSFRIDNQTSGDDTAAVVTINSTDSGYVGENGDLAKGAYVLQEDQAGGDNTVYIPSIKHDFGGQTSKLIIQNAHYSSYGSAYVSVSFYDRNGTQRTGNFYVYEDYPAVLDPSDFNVPSCNGGVSNTCIGVALISSAKKIMAHVVEYDDDADATDFAGVYRGVGDDEATNTAFAASMKNDYYGVSTGATVMNPSATSKTYNLRFVVTQVDNGSSCSVQPGDVKTDTVTVSGRSHAIVNAAKGNIGGIPNCALFTMKASHASAEVVFVIYEKTGTPTRLQVYNSLPEGSADFYVPLYKQDFPSPGGDSGNIMVMNTTSTCSKVEFDFWQGTARYGITTKSLCEGEAVNISNIDGNNPSNGWWTHDNPLFRPQDHNKFLVVATAQTSGAEFVALYKSQTDSGSPTQDTMSHEGIPFD